MKIPVYEKNKKTDWMSVSPSGWIAAFTFSNPCVWLAKKKKRKTQRQKKGLIHPWEENGWEGDLANQIMDAQTKKSEEVSELDNWQAGGKKRALWPRRDWRRSHFGWRHQRPLHQLQGHPDQEKQPARAPSCTRKINTLKNGSHSTGCHSRLAWKPALAWATGASKVKR